MKDESYIRRTIEQLTREKELHDEKFAGNEAHSGCAANFDRAIENLENDEYGIICLVSESFDTETKKTQVPKVDEPADYTDAGDIGDEQMPAGDTKTDKKAWNYDASKNLDAEIPKKVKEFMAGL